MKLFERNKSWIANGKGWNLSRYDDNKLEQVMENLNDKGENDENKAEHDVHDEDGIEMNLVVGDWGLA